MISAATSPNRAAIVRERSPKELESAKSLLDASIQMDSQWFDAIRLLAPDDTELLNQRLARSYTDRGLVFDALGQADLAKMDREKAELLSRDTEISGVKIDQSDKEIEPWRSVLDVWTWDDPVLGGKLGHGHPNARMLVLQLNSEFMAVGNIKLMEAVEQLVEEVRTLHRSLAD